jgi:4-amino-4-deoxy-L-arabinose transferase-like glycosyltransferase
VTKLFWIVLAKTLLLIAFILFGPLGLSPDEAQYWTWSQHPSLGYYSKPPGIAYQIGLTTLFLGNNELGVRFGSLIFGALMPFLIYLLAKQVSLSDEEAFWSGVIWCFIPIGLIGSLLAITDVGMIFFWTLGLYYLLKEGATPKLGLIIACGALFKFPIYFFWLAALFLIPIDKKWMKALLISLVGLIPSLIWNIQNNFVTFRHVSATLPGGTSALLSQGNPLEFIGTQIGLLSPILFFIFMIGFIRTRWEETPRPIVFLGFITIFILAVGIVTSFFTKVQGNWIIFAYPSAIPFLVWAATHQFSKGEDWLRIGLALSLLLIIVALFLPYKMSPFKANFSGRPLTKILEEAGYDPEEQYLFSDTYQTTALLSFYAPGQKQAFFLNIHGNRHNQYSLWPGVETTSLDKEGYFVSLENKTSTDLAKLLKPYFNAVLSKGTFPLINKQVQVLETFQYNGKKPDEGTRF